jgi:hypothetical protein
MFVCCVYCVLSGRGLSDELITRLEESYRLWRVVVCVIKKPRGRGNHSPRWAAKPEKKNALYISFVGWYLIDALCFRILFVWIPTVGYAVA